MINKIKLNWSLVVFIVALTTSFQISANAGISISPGIFSELTDSHNRLLSPTNTIFIKKGEKYDESKDPALRRGTENTEQPQSSFFAIPAVVIGLIAVVLFLSKEKK